jgi:hypothetical protein
MRFSSNLLRDSWNLGEGLATDDLVANSFPRTGDSVANHARRFYDSLINIYTLSSVSRRTANQKSTKIGEPQAQLPILLRNSKNLGDCWPEMRQNLNSYLKSKEHH